MARNEKNNSKVIKKNFYITVLQLQEHFDNEWVLIENPKFSDKNEFVGGNFIYNHKDRNKVSTKAKSLPSPKSIKIFYTGQYESEGEEFFL